MFTFEFIIILFNIIKTCRVTIVISYKEHQIHMNNYDSGNSANYNNRKQKEKYENDEFELKKHLDILNQFGMRRYHNL